MSERVLITGLGIVSPIGTDRQSFWKACLEGRSGARTQENPWVRDTDIRPKFTSSVQDYDPTTAGISKRFARNMDRVAQFSVSAAGEALRDAGFELTEREGTRGLLLPDGVDPWRLSTSLGSGIGGLSTTELTHGQWRDLKTKTPVRRFSLPMLIPNSPAGQVAIHYGAKGECKSIATACATGTMSIGDGWRLIRSGEADVVIAGGADAVAADHDGYALMGFDRLSTLSTRNDDPERASRPFDKDRDGFVLGEGAGVVILERESHARARGARAYAAVAGYGTNCDALSMMQLDESGDSILNLVGRALASARLDLDAIDHINAHGTSTLLNDKTEALAIRRLFGDRADDIPVTALKSMTGHAIAGSGAMEVIALALAFSEGIVTPTINHDQTDPECPIRIAANEPLKFRPRAALKMSYGFGGHNACLVLTGVDDGQA